MPLALCCAVPRRAASYRAAAQVKELRTLFVVATFVGLVVFVALCTRVYLGAIDQEAAHVAGLLSHVPADVDVASHVSPVAAWGDGWRHVILSWRILITRSGAWTQALAHLVRTSLGLILVTPLVRGWAAVELSC